MYHPTRGGVRGGRDQFKWDDVKVDKHRENYLGHSLKAPVGRWQKGKDLFWYARDKKSRSLDAEAAKAEIQRIKEEEDQAMREALGLAPKRSSRPQGNRLDKHEFAELVKRGSTAEDLGEGHAEAAHVEGLGFARAPRSWDNDVSSSHPPSLKETAPESVNGALLNPPATNTEKQESDVERMRRKERKREKKHEKHEKREKREKRHSRDSNDKREHRDKKKRRHDSD